MLGSSLGSVPDKPVFRKYMLNHVSRMCKGTQ